LCGPPHDRTALSRNRKGGLIGGRRRAAMFQYEHAEQDGAGADHPGAGRGQLDPLRRPDYAQLIKDFGVERSEDASPTARRYSPNVVKGMDIRVIHGDPDPAAISTSYIERNNLTMRMGMRRLTRPTNGFSKKVENHAAMVSLHFMHYNFARPHSGLGKNVTPAMAAGVADHVWTPEEIAALLD
jgi:hypothetical protein